MRTVALGQILINYFHTFSADERTPTEFPLCQFIRWPHHKTTAWFYVSALQQRTLMEQASLCIYYMLIAVSCVHCSDATVKHEFSEQHMRIVN